jgi:hypothetical protein
MEVHLADGGLRFAQRKCNPTSGRPLTAGPSRPGSGIGQTWLLDCGAATACFRRYPAVGARVGEGPKTTPSRPPAQVSSVRFYPLVIARLRHLVRLWFLAAYQPVERSAPAARAAGDRCSRLRLRRTAAHNAFVGGTIAARIDGGLAPGRRDHVDIRVVAYVASDPRPDLEHLGVTVRAVL